MYFGTECIMTLQDHPRSLISAPIKSAYGTFILVLNSNLGLILLRLRDITAFVSKATFPYPPLFPPKKIWGVPFEVDP